LDIKNLSLIIEQLDSEAKVKQLYYIQYAQPVAYKKEREEDNTRYSQVLAF